MRHNGDPVPTPLLQLYPLNGTVARTQIVEDLLDLTRSGKHDAVTVIIEMLDDLHGRGRSSRHLHKLKGLPLFELKPMSRGGHGGGARVYLAFTEFHEALILTAEAKAQDVSSPDPAKLTQAIRMLRAYEQGSLKSAPNKEGKPWRS